jgi:hypothetical protein
MHGPSCGFWANRPPFWLQERDLVKRRYGNYITGGGWKFSRDTWREWYRERITVRVGSPFDVLVAGTAEHAPAWFIEVLILKMAINAFYTTRNILEWHVAVNAVLVASGCALLIARPYANPYDLPLELSVMLALGCAVHLDTYRLTGAIADHMFMAIAGVLGAVPLIFFIWGNLQGKREDKALKAALDVAEAAPGRSLGSGGPADAGRLEPEPEAPTERRRSGVRMERHRPPTAEDTALYMDGFRDLGSRPPDDPDEASKKVRGCHSCATLAQWHCALERAAPVHRRHSCAPHGPRGAAAPAPAVRPGCWPLWVFGPRGQLPCRCWPGVEDRDPDPLEHGRGVGPVRPLDCYLMKFLSWHLN